jgi:hypothetical protein
MRPSLLEVGIVPASPLSEGEPQDETLLQEIEDARRPHEIAELADRAWHDRLLQHETTIVDRDGEDYQKYREYLAVEKAYDDEQEGRGPDAMTLSEYELMRLHEYHGMDKHPNYAVTNGFVAQFALASVRQHKYAKRQAGALVAFKHYTKRNVEILEGELSDEDREIYKPLTPLATEVYRAQALAADPEARTLSDRYKVLEAIFQKRWAVDTLAKILGTEIDEEFGRVNMQALANFVERFGYNITI